MRGGSKSHGRSSPSIAANASSTHRSAPASGHGRLIAAEEADRPGLERMTLQLAADHAAVEEQRVEREAGEAEAQTVEHRDERQRLDLDAGLLVDLLHRDLGRRVADVGLADRVEPHPGVGALGEQQLTPLVGDDRRHRDLGGDVARDALADEPIHSSTSASASASSMAAARMSAATLSTSSKRSFS